MKIATKTGDKGYSSILSGERLLKSNKIFESVGNLDELNVCIGFVKVLLDERSSNFFILEKIQKNLILLMGEISYFGNFDDFRNKYNSLELDDLEKLDKEVDLLQDLPELKQNDWILYGKTELGVRFDLASKVCRRAERSVLEFAKRDIIIKYLNRLSDLLYLLARLYEVNLCVKK